MREKVKNIIVILILVLLIEFGLFSVGFDAACRENFEIKDISFKVLFVFPAIIVSGFFEQLVKSAIFVSLMITTFLIVYLSVVYEFELFEGGMIIFPLGYIFLLVFSGYFLHTMKKKKDIE